ncbi:BZIP transcription factor [Musa troglodytarum]|uniref:BZIP transcription factor n=1 Tax=Musa troglodytarum TaxID=320322 RepID=A0A9E7JV30_9LILI|nr:BZIP transcription factor [Musa troglodytarum]
MDDGEVDLSSHLLVSDPEINQSFDEFLRGTSTCTHTHTCNPPGPAAATHTHTCYHTHTQVFAAGEEGESFGEEEPKRSRKPLGNKEAVRKYREKKKAHAAFLEEEVKKLRLVNQQLLRRLQGQAALEAEVIRLRSLLVDFRGKIDAELGGFPFQNQCRPGGLQCDADGQFISRNLAAIDWEGSHVPAITNCEINPNADIIMRQKLEIAEAVNSMNDAGDALPRKVVTAPQREAWSLITMLAPNSHVARSWTPACVTALIKDPSAEQSTGRSSLGVILPVAARRSLQELPRLLISLGGLLLRLLGLKPLQLGVVVVGNAKEGDGIAEEIDAGDGVADNGPGEGDQEPVLNNACDVHGEGGGLADEEEDGEVEGEGAEAVGAEDEEIGAECGGGQAVAENGELDEGPGDEEEGEAAGGDVVKGGDGVEGDALGSEEDLDEDEAGGLEGDGRELQGDAGRNEAGLAVGGDGDAEGDG